MELGSARVLLKMHLGCWESRFFYREALLALPAGHELWKPAHLYAKRSVIIAGGVLGKPGTKLISL
jgi:hypothetical protein